MCVECAISNSNDISNDGFNTELQTILNAKIIDYGICKMK